MNLGSIGVGMGYDELVARIYVMMFSLEMRGG